MTTRTRRSNREGSKPVQRKDGRWQIGVAYTDADGVFRRTSVTGKTAAEARRKAKEVRDRIRKGQPARDAKVTVAAFTQTWIDGALAASDRKPNTKVMYAGVAKKHLIERTIGNVALDRLTPSRIEAWVVELRNAGLAQSTIRSAYTILRAILDTAVRDGHLGSNQAAKLKRPKVDHHEAAYLTPEQVRKLLEASSGSRYKPLFELLVNTAMRRGEALALTWADLDLDKGLLRVRGTLARVDGALTVTDPKTAKSRRTVPLSPRAVAVLKEVRKRQLQERLVAGSQWHETPYVFTTELGEPCDPRNALRALKAASVKAKLPGIGLHTLRHSAASTMLANGVSLKVVSEICGHASVAITGDIYGHVSPEVAADAVAALSRALNA